jgi:ABC-type long-subunit fatty acid transport system fused permease/ATPase subunit
MLAEQSNMKLEVSYNSQAKKFKFTFPTHDAIIKATLLVPTDLAERLGFGMVTDISEVNKEGERAED